MQFTVQPGGKLFTIEVVVPPPCFGIATAKAVRDESMPREEKCIAKVW